MSILNRFKNSLGSPSKFENWLLISSIIKTWLLFASKYDDNLLLSIWTNLDALPVKAIIDSLLVVLYSKSTAVA